MTSSDHYRPFHVLMTAGAETRPSLKDPRIANDYLARRASAFNTPQTDVWSAAFPIERAFVDCCEMDRGDGESSNVVVEGALMRKNVVRFVELMTKYGYNPETRILVVAILERTLEQDLLNRSEGNESKKQSSHCFSRFLAAGGLKIVNQWLLDAMTPYQANYRKPQAAATKKLKMSIQQPVPVDQLAPSSNGPLLMPLLEILERMPLDKNLITSTKINKSIRKLEKQLADLPRKLSDPRAGGYIVGDVLAAIEALKNAWRTERHAYSEGLAKDPFRKLQQEMMEKLAALESFDAVGCAVDKEKPAWLSHFQSVERLAKDRKEFLKLTPEERERKIALLDIQRKREETNKRYEELLVKKRKASSQQVVKTKKTVRWKDGKDQGNGLLMQQVFHYPPEFNTLYPYAQDMPEGNSDGDDSDDDDEDMWN